MNKLIFQLYRIIVPKPIRTVILKKTLRFRILKYYSLLPQEQVNEETSEVLSWLRKNTLAIFPYPFNYAYPKDDVEVLYDKEHNLRYVMFDGKRLYFRRGWSISRIKRAWSDLLREQDSHSPHRYLDGNFVPGKDDVVADIGAAEGNFALSVVEKVKKIYLFENDRRWIEALNATFKPWKDKTEIVHKYAGSVNDQTHVTMDTFFEKTEHPTFLKIDVDGNEDSVLRGCHGIFLAGKPMKVALCTYHKNDDETLFTTLLENVGFTVTPSKGYMIHFYDKKMKAPYLRRGLIRAHR